MPFPVQRDWDAWYRIPEENFIMKADADVNPVSFVR